MIRLARSHINRNWNISEKNYWPCTGTINRTACPTRWNCFVTQAKTKISNSPKMLSLCKACEKETYADAISFFVLIFFISNIQMNAMTANRCVSCEIAVRSMPLDLNDDKSTLDQVKALCHQAPSHNLIQYWPKSKSPYGVTRPQWVKHIDAETKLSPFFWQPFQVQFEMLKLFLFHQNFTWTGFRGFNS